MRRRLTRAPEACGLTPPTHLSRASTRNPLPEECGGPTNRSSRSGRSDDTAVEVVATDPDSICVAGKTLAGHRGHEATAPGGAIAGRAASHGAGARPVIESPHRQKCPYSAPKAKILKSASTASRARGFRKRPHEANAHGSGRLPGERSLRLLDPDARPAADSSGFGLSHRRRLRVYSNVGVGRRRLAGVALVAEIVTGSAPGPAPPVSYRVERAGALQARGAQ